MALKRAVMMDVRRVDQTVVAMVDVKVVVSVSSMVVQKVAQKVGAKMAAMKVQMMVEKMVALMVLVKAASQAFEKDKIQAVQMDIQKDKKRVVLMVQMLAKLFLYMMAHWKVVQLVAVMVDQLVSQKEYLQAEMRVVELAI